MNTFGKTLIIGFDMETDIGSWTGGDRGMTDGTPEILRVLRNHHVQATFLFTGSEAKNHPGLVQSVLTDGHEVGCHTMYHETIGQAVFDMPGDMFVLDHEVEGRLTLATEAIQEVAGVRPVSFRAPRLFGSTRMINVLEQLGYLVDSSLPAYFFGRDFSPYRPNRSDWTKEGDSSVLEIPVFYDMDADSDEKHRSRDQWPMLRLKGADYFYDLCDRMIKKITSPDGRSVLCLYLHPWEFVAMPETIVTDEATITFKPFLHENTGLFALDALDAFIDRMKQSGATFTTMKAFALNYS